MQAYDAILPAPMCPLGICFTGDALTRVAFLPARTARITHGTDSRVRWLTRELEAYWADPAHSFDLSFVQQGTPFQIRVWNTLLDIPAGQPTTYGELAKQLGTAARAVGQACGSNPLPIVFPCHRVVSASGLGGFMHASAGAPLGVKAWLLNHEKPAQTPP
ncbi:MAG TPA: methylated-DNA--[protein]-cysteine S-methyltransferase [Thiobacillus sp.]